MAVTWRNNEQKTDEGEYVVDVDAENGTQVQTFRGKSRRDVINQMGQTVFTGSRKIKELNDERVPDRQGAPKRIEPKPLSADERMRIATEITDPELADAAIDRLIEAKYGSLEIITERENRRIQEEDEARAIRETEKFVANNPDWYPSANNKKGVFDYIEGNKLDITAKNMSIAWDAMKGAGAAEMKPAEQPKEDEPEPEPKTRPRLASYATGLREGDVSRVAPATSGGNKLSWAIIDQMGSKEYERRLREETGFAAKVDALPPRR